MKNIMTLLLLIAITSSCTSQIINLKTWNGKQTANHYYKDIDNELNQFEGTYQYINGTAELTFVFKKHTNYFNTSYYQDLLVGEFKYKQNGIVLVDNLNRINQNLSNKYSHDLSGNTLINNSSKPICDNCQANQWRAKIIFFGRNNNKNGGSAILQKFIENGQQKLKVTLLFSNIITPDNPIPLEPILPSGEYVLTRIN